MCGACLRSPHHNLAPHPEPAKRLTTWRTSSPRSSATGRTRSRSRAQQGREDRLKSAVRKFRELAEAGDKEEAVEAAQDATRKLDKAASKGVIHKNQAANRKSAIDKKAASL